MKLILKSLREFKFLSIITPVLILIEVFFVILVPTVMAKLIDEGLTQNNFDNITKYSLLLLLLAVISLLLGLLISYTASKATAGFAANLRGDIFRKIESFSFSNIDKYSKSGLITRLTTDVNNVKMAFNTIIRMTVRSFVMTAAALFMTYQISPSIAKIYIVAVPLLILVMVIVFIISYPIFDRAFEAYEELNLVVGENVHAIRVVKSYVNEEKEKSKFEKISTKIFQDMVKANRVYSYEGPSLQGIVYMVVLLISWIGAKQIVSNTLTTGELSSLITYAMNVLYSLWALGMILVRVAMAFSSSKRIVKVLKEEVDIKNIENPITEVDNFNIEFKNVYFKYNLKAKKYVLKDINLKIDQGETIGIVGLTGSAKTSLVSLISRIYDVSEGELLINDKNVKEYELKFLRNNIRNVLQKNILFSGTIKENLKWGKADASDEEMIEACKIASIHDFIDNLKDGYDSSVSQGGTNFSGGQRQRLCIARALINKPKVLIFDDSTSAVDTKTDASIREALKNTLASTTKIIVAQRISSVMDANKIVIMTNGRITDIGTHEELIKRQESYRNTYNAQTEGVKQ